MVRRRDALTLSEDLGTTPGHGFGDERRVKTGFFLNLRCIEEGRGDGLHGVFSVASGAGHEEPESPALLDWTGNEPGSAAKRAESG